MVIGQRIKIARKNQGLTQKELAERAGTATGTIQQYELGKRQPRMDLLQKIASVLGVSMDYLLGFGKIREAALDSSHDGENAPLPGLVSGDKIEEVARRDDLLKYYSYLNESGQKKAIERVEELTEIPKYQKKKDDQ